MDLEKEKEKSSKRGEYQRRQQVSITQEVIVRPRKGKLK